MINTFLIVILVYYLASIVIIVSDSIKTRNNQMNIVELFFSACIILTLPILGAFVIVSFRIFSIHIKNSIIDLAPEIHFTGIRSDILYKSDPYKEKNIIPMEEALIINNNQTKRTLLIEALKRDFFKSLYFIQKAIRDRDTETSHYAASALMELKDKLNRDLRMASAMYNMDRNNMQYLEAYALAIKQIIESNINNDGDLESLSNDYISILKQLNILLPDEGKYYQDSINFMLKVGEYEQAELVCARYLQNERNSEAPYLLYLKIYYIMGKHSEFIKMLRLLQTSNVRLSSHGINIIRFWLREGEING
jgi:hypothetical protein